MSSKPAYLILVASGPLNHLEFVYEINYVPFGTPFEWCKPEQAQVVLRTRSTEKKNFSCQLQYITN